MTDVNINEAAVAEMFSDPAGPVAELIYELTDNVRTLAKASAPVSPTGSAFSPPGTLKAKVRVTHGHAADGTVQGRVSAPGYPYWFIANSKGVTRNANKVHGTVRYYGTRPAMNNFMVYALTTVFETSTLFDTGEL